MEMQKENCLVCLASSDEIPLHSLLERFAHNEDFELSIKTTSKPSTNTILNQQLSVVFLLRKVLRLKKSILEKTLQDIGNNPSSWELKLCRVCFRTFEEADFVFTRLRKLHVEFIRLSSVLCKKLIQSVRSENAKKVHFDDELPSEPPRPLRRKRKPGRPRRKEVLQNCQEVSSLTTVGDRIRKAIFTQAIEDPSMAYDCDDFTLQYQDTYNISVNSSWPPPPNLKFMKTEFGRVKNNTSIEISETDMRDHDDNGFDHLSDTECNDNLIDWEGNEVENVSEVGEGGSIENNGESDMDNTAGDLDLNDNDYDSGEINNLSSNEDSDSDFEISSRRKPSKSKSKRSRRTKRTESKEIGMILKAVKMENSGSYTCPKCSEIFENAFSCNAHILHKHYGGKQPRDFACHLCENVSFKGENWLRQHYKLRHPGIKWTVDETIERSIDEGTMPELTYDVIPVGQSVPLPDNPSDNAIQLNDETEDPSLFNKTFDDPPLNSFSIPVVQTSGYIRHLVLPRAIKQLPEVSSLIEVGPEEKACKSCDKKYPTELQLRAHIKRAHEGDTTASYECPICPKQFERVGRVLFHVQKTHILSRNVCYKCGNTFKEEILLKAHIHRVHFGIEYPYRCIKCNIRYPRRSMLNKHLKRVHKLQIASYFLLSKPKKKPNIARQAVLRKKKKMRLEKKFPCETCKENGILMKFATEEELDIHIKRQHMGISRPYPCSICEKRYSTPAKVEEHMKIHTVRSDLHVDDDASTSVKPMPFVCHPCNKQFETRTRYNAHLKGRNHQNVKPYVCELCSQGFTGLKYLKNHQSQKHHKELNIDPFKCKFCSRVLSSERTLNDHIKLRHTKDALFSCPHCDVQFQHKSARDAHINALHTKSEHFLCPQCPKMFLRDFYLKNHMMRVHSGKKPYECQYCFKKFSDKPTYNRHVEAHSNVVHNCPHCGKTGFKTRHALRVHYKTFHKEILEEMERKKKLEAIVRPEQLTEISQKSNDSFSVSTETYNNAKSEGEETNSLGPEDSPINQELSSAANSLTNSDSLFL